MKKLMTSAILLAVVMESSAVTVVPTEHYAQEAEGLVIYGDTSSRGILSSSMDVDDKLLRLQAGDIIVLEGFNQGSAACFPAGYLRNQIGVTQSFNVRYKKNKQAKSEEFGRYSCFATAQSYPNRNDLNIQNIEFGNAQQLANRYSQDSALIPGNILVVHQAVSGLA